MNRSIATSFVSELEKLANLSRLAFGPMPKAVAEKTVAKKVVESTKVLPSHLSRKAKSPPPPADWGRLQEMFRNANKRRLEALGKKWKPGMTPHQAAMEAIPTVKVADAGSLAAAVGGALAGGAVGDRVIKATKGRLALPIALSSSLGGSMVAGDLYYKHKRRKARKRRSAGYDDYRYELQRRRGMY